MSLFLCILSTLIWSRCDAQSPPEIIDKIVKTMISKNSSSCRFFQYNYGSAIILDSMYRATDQFSAKQNNFNTSKILDYNSFISSILSFYLYNDSYTPAYIITNGQQIPFNSTIEGAIGDHVGLFPITYIDNLLYEYMKNNDSEIFNFDGKYSTEWQLIFTTADYYILQFPRYLPDQYNTISRDRNGAWLNQTDKNASFVWADDNYMGLTLLTRLAQILDYCNKYVDDCNNVNVTGNISKYINFVYNNNMGFAQSLIYPNSKYNGLYSHGYNYASHDHSCCPWGRANAWIMTAHTEAIRMYKYLNNTAYDAQYKDLLTLYSNHVNEIGSLQDAHSGKWRQVINDSSTFDESSGSTGFLYGILIGKLNGILPTNVFTENEWDNIIELAWNGLLTFVNMSSGEVYDGCQGTGIQNDVQEYQDRSTKYCSCGSPGDPAFVINAITTYQQYLNTKHNIV